MSSAQVPVVQDLSPTQAAAVRYAPQLAPVLALLLLPLAILSLNSRWFYSGPYRDPWIYYGFFQAAPSYISAFHEQYYATRLSVILPGYVAHRLLPALAAHFAVHLAVYWTAVLCLYATARELFGRRAAGIAALAMGGYPFLLYATGWDHVDGYGVAYACAALCALTLAATRRRWPLSLLLAGAAAVALVTTNLVYAVYLPFLAGHFLVVNHARGRRPLPRSALYAAGGAAGLFALLGAVNAAFGGPFFYSLASLRWAVQLRQEANPFWHPASTWMASATWLVLPAAVFLGSLALLEQLRREPPGTERRLAVSAQLLYLSFAALATFLQLAGDMVLLEVSFYASLLIPLAFLALGGQIAWLVRGVSRNAFAILAAVTVLAQLVPPALAGGEPVPELMRFPVLLPLAAGAAAALILWLGARGARASFAFLLLFGLCQTLLSEVSWVFVRRDGYDGRGRELFLQIDRAIATIHAEDPRWQARLWYDLGEENGPLYDSVASAFLLCSRMINHDFPKLPAAQSCDLQPIVAGQRIALLATRPSAAAEAIAALKGVGLDGRYLSRRAIPGPARGFAITFLEILPAAPGRADKRVPT